MLQLRKASPGVVHHAPCTDLLRLGRVTGFDLGGGFEHGMGDGGGDLVLVFMFIVSLVIFSARDLSNTSETAVELCGVTIRACHSAG